MKIIKISLLAILLPIANSSYGAVTAALFDSIGSPNSTTITAGSSFTFSLSLTTTTETTIGVSYYITTGLSGSGLFSITGRDVTGSSYSDLATSDSLSTTSLDNLAPSGADNLLNTTNDRDLGGSLLTGSNSPGTYFISNITIASSALTNTGAYTFSLSNNSIAADDSFNDVSISSNTYTVNVIGVPEPSTYAMMGLWSLVLGGAAWRRRLAKARLT
jgi:hypothetical protein